MQPHVRRSAREVSQTQVFQAESVPSGHWRVEAAMRGSRLNREASHALAATLARLSEAEAKCAKELREQTAAPSDRPAWASERIATAAVPLCHDPMAAADAAGTLANLTADDEGSNAVVEAGAIVPLVAMLRGGPESAAEQAVRALQNLAAGINATAVLEEVARTQIDCSPWEDLREKLLACASGELQAAEEGSAVAALEHAITLAEAVQVDAAAVNARRVGCGRSTATRSGRSGASRSGWGRLRCRTSSCARLRGPRCETRWWRPTATHMSGRPSSRCSANATP